MAERRPYLPSLTSYERTETASSNSQRRHQTTDIDDSEDDLPPRRRYASAREYDVSDDSTRPLDESDDEPLPQRYTRRDIDDSDDEAPVAHEGEVEKFRLVIAVDFGTTYTGVAYATPKAARYTLNEIDVVYNWGQQGTNLPKVPSVISCSPGTRRSKQQWGKGINDDAVTMVHMKLELDVRNVTDELRFIQQTLEGMDNLRFLSIKSPGSQPAYTHKKPEAIVTDFLTLVFEHSQEVIKQDLERELGFALREQLPTDIVATIPTGWSDRAVNSTYRALVDAGFNSRNFPKMAEGNQILFVTEPEAAALYTAKHLKDALKVEILNHGGCFILCDAGGGTVDVVSYRVKGVNPLELVEIGGPTADRCGSIFINMEFKKWLRELIGSENYGLIDSNTVMGRITSHVVEGKPMRELMKEFNKLKERFTGEEDEDYLWRLPAPLDKLTSNQRPDGGKVVQGKLTLPVVAMCQFFDHCITKIAVLIKDHYKKIENSGYMAKNLFLVGGFGESPYLKTQLEETFADWHMTLRVPDKSMTAVVQGAVISGIEKNITSNIIKATGCRHSYGIRVAEEFSVLKNDRRDVIKDKVTGEIMADGQMRWLLNKGDAVRSDKPLEAEQEIDVRFEKTDERSPKTGKVRIWQWSQDGDRPKRYHNRRNELGPGICVLNYDLSRHSWKEFDAVGRGFSKSVYATVMTLKLSLNWNQLGAQLIWKGEVIAKAENIAY